MGEFLLAIWADRNTCKPYTGPGRVGHVVRVTDMPHPTIINEFTDGGSFEHADCAPASLQSWFIDKAGVTTTIREIEQLAGTGPNGTGWKGIEVAGLHFNLQIKFSPDNPPAGYVMNPGGGYVDPPSEFASYLAATQGGCLVLPNVNVAPKPPAPQPPQLLPQEEDVAAVVIRSAPSVDPAGAGAVWLVRDPVYGPKRHITANGDLAGYLKATGQSAPKVIDAYILDRMERGPDIDSSITSPPEA